MARERNHHIVRRRGQNGETLIESLVALAVLSIIAIPIFAGINIALNASVLSHDIAVSETLLRSAAENLQNPDLEYIPLAGCPGHDTYSHLPTRPDFSPISVSVQFWSPSPLPNNPDHTDYKGAASASTAEFGFVATGTCPSEDPGLQKIHLTLVTPAGHIQKLDVLKRAN